MDLLKIWGTEFFFNVFIIGYWVLEKEITVFENNNVQDLEVFYWGKISL